MPTCRRGLTRALFCLFVPACIVVFPSRAAGQASPLPGVRAGESTGFLTRAEWLFSFAGMKSDDPRFSEAARSRADVDVAGYPKGRVNFLFDVEFVMGSERRTFDLNHQNIVFETSASYRVASIDLAAVGHHVSRHLVDRAFERSVVAWHTVGARAERAFTARQSSLAITFQYDEVVQHTYVDYRRTSQATIRFDRSLAGGSHVFAGGSGGFVGIDRAVVNRDRQFGARVEGGVRLPGRRAGFDLFAAYERRVDGYPTARQPSTWAEAGFRLASR